MNFEQEDHEMKMLSEDETMISTSVGSELSLRSPLEEIPRPNPRGNSPMRYRGGEVIRGGGSPTKTRRLSFKVIIFSLIMVMYKLHWNPIKCKELPSI